MAGGSGTGYRIRALHYGTQTVPGAQVFFQYKFDQWQDFYYYAFLLEGNGQKILVDTGMDELGGFYDLVEEALGSKGVPRLVVPLTDLLRLQGVQPQDVDAILVTHFHADHVWNLDKFPNADIYISEPGWNALRSLRQELPEMTPDPLYPTHALEFVEREMGTRVHLLKDGSTPFPGIEIKHLGGHSIDMTGYTVDTSQGRAVMPMDTVWTYANLEQGRPPGLAVDIPACMRAQKWVQEAGDFMIPGHDPLLLDRYVEGVI